jgi:hypothetical protein
MGSMAGARGPGSNGLGLTGDPLRARGGVLQISNFFVRHRLRLSVAATLLRV